MISILSMTFRKYIVYFLAVVFVFLSYGCKKSKDVVLKVGPVSVTQEEFDKAFQSSQFAGDPDGRRAFAEQYVNQKLILLEAERQGIDKDPKFLDDLQKFWEERLLRASILSKFDEYRSVAQATDEEVNRIYEESKGSKALPDDPQKAREQISMMIAQEKQNQLLSKWMDSLRQKNHVFVDEQKLGLKK